MPAHSLESAAKICTQANAPILLLDTCVLMDIVRAPVRDDPSTVKTALELVKQLSSVPPTIQFAVTSIIVAEWNEHILRVRDEVVKKIRDLNQRVAILHEICHECNLHSEVAKHVYDDQAITAQLQQVSTRLLDSAIVLGHDAQCSARAHQRAITYRPPAQKGSQSKDCDIIEHFLGLALELTKAGFGHQCVFVSSNTNDYCIDGKLHSDLKTEFDAVALLFATNLSWARSLT